MLISLKNKKATLSSLIIKPKVLKEAYNSITKNQREALNLAYDRINFYHSHQNKKKYINLKTGSIQLFLSNGTL